MNVPILGTILLQGNIDHPTHNTSGMLIYKAPFDRFVVHELNVLVDVIEQNDCYIVSGGIFLYGKYRNSKSESH